MSGGLEDEFPLKNGLFSVSNCSFAGGDLKQQECEVTQLKILKMGVFGDVTKKWAP